MAIPDLTPHQLTVLKDTILLRLILDQGGIYKMSYEEVSQIAEEWNGWGVFLRGTPEGMELVVKQPEVQA